MAKPPTKPPAKTGYQVQIGPTKPVYGSRLKQPKAPKNDRH